MFLLFKKKDIIIIIIITIIIIINMEMLVFEERGKTRVLGEKPLEAKGRTNNKLNPHNSGVDAGIWTRATLVTLVVNK